MTFAQRVERYEESLDAELGAGWDAEKAMLAAGEPDEPETEESAMSVRQRYLFGLAWEGFYDTIQSIVGKPEPPPSEVNWIFYRPVKGRSHE